MLLKPLTNLPTSDETELPVNVVDEANKRVANVLEQQGEACAGKGNTGKRQYNTTLTPKDRPAMGIDKTYCGTNYYHCH